MKKVLLLTSLPALISFFMILATSSIADELLPFEELEPFAVQNVVNHAKATLRTIAQGAEVYAIENNRVYPTTEEDMLNSMPATLSKSICGKREMYYFFECIFTVAGYSATAKPAIKVNLPSFKITTGQLLTEL